MDSSVKKAALAFALFCFAFLAIGSWIYGARVTVALVRGLEGFVVFGLLAWVIGQKLAASGILNQPSSTGHEEENETRGEHLDQSV